MDSSRFLALPEIIQQDNANILKAQKEATQAKARCKVVEREGTKETKRKEEELQLQIMACKEAQVAKRVERERQDVERMGTRRRRGACEPVESRSPPTQ